MIIQKKSINELKRAGYNPLKELRQGDTEYEKLKRSIEEFGYVEPIIWNERTQTVVGGHQRLTVLIDLGHTEVDCVIVDLPEDKEKALNIALNKIEGEWDNEKLTDLLNELNDIDFDLELTGFDLDELEDLLNFDTGNEEVEEDDFEVEVPEEPKAKLGDIYQLGNHRLMCGNSTSEEDVAKLMNGNKADMVFTDPPYGVSYEGGLNDKKKAQ